MADVPVTLEFDGDGDSAVRETKRVNEELNNTNKSTHKSITLTNLLIAARKRLLGITSVLVALQLGKMFLGHVKAIDQFSQSVEISVQKAQALGFASKRTGLQLSELEAVILNLARESGRENNLFQVLGLSIQDLRRMQPVEIFEKIAEMVDKGGMNATQMSAAIKLMGVNGEKTFMSLSSSFKRFKDEAEGGELFSTESVRGLAEETEKLKLSWEGLSDTLKESFIPVLRTGAEESSGLVGHVSKGINALRAGSPFVKELAKVALLLPKSKDEVSLKDNINANPLVMAAKFASLSKRTDTITASTRTDQGGISAADVAKRQGQAERIRNLIKGFGGGQSPADSLARAGLFATPGATEAGMKRERQNQLLERIAANTKNTVDAVREEQ